MRGGERIQRLLSVIDESGGNLTVNSDRLLICPANAAAMLGSALTDLLGLDGADALLREAIYPAGEEWAKSAKQLLFDMGAEADTPEEAIRVSVEELMSVFGWGHLRLVELSLEHPVKVVIRVENPYIRSVKVENSQDPLCHVSKWLVTGLIGGFLRDYGFSGDLDAVETKCVAKGDPYCEFVITET